MTSRSQLRFEQHAKSRRRIEIPARVAERAATRYEEDDKGCYISTYYTASHGYAQIGWQEEGHRYCVTAHRASWVYSNGKQIPNGMTVDHICKNRQCVNPKHLRIMENFENARRTAGRDLEIGMCVNGHSNELLHQQPSGRLVCPPCARKRREEWKANNPEKENEAQRRYRLKKHDQRSS